MSKQKLTPHGEAPHGNNIAPALVEHSHSEADSQLDTTRTGAQAVLKADAHGHGGVELMEFWRNGFYERGGYALSQAIKEDRLQEYINGLTGLKEALQPHGETITFRCIEGREPTCGCGIAGCGVLIADSQGNPRVASVEEMARNIAYSPIVRNADSNVKFGIAEHPDCGANGIALKMLQEKDPQHYGSMTPDEFGLLRGQAVLDELERILPGRTIPLKKTTMKELVGPRGRHPEQSLVIIGFNGYLNPSNKELPQAMQVDVGTFTNENDLRLHIATGIKILLDPHHGPMQKPIYVYGLGEKGLIDSYESLVREVIAEMHLPEGSVLFGGMAHVPASA